jgi:hypothetical protein
MGYAGAIPPSAARPRNDELKPLMIERASWCYGEKRGVVIRSGAVARCWIRRRVLELLDAIDCSTSLNYDISHFSGVMGINRQSVGALAAHTATHVKDERGVVPDYQFLIPGEGEFDMLHTFRRREHGYSGFITAGISIMVQRRPAYDPLAAAGRPTERSRAPLSRRGCTMSKLRVGVIGCGSISSNHIRSCDSAARDRGRPTLKRLWPKDAAFSITRHYTDARACWREQ